MLPSKQRTRARQDFDVECLAADEIAILQAQLSQEIDEIAARYGIDRTDALQHERAFLAALN